MKIVKCDLCNKECTCSEIDVPVWHSNDIIEHHTMDLCMECLKKVVTVSKTSNGYDKGVIRNDFSNRSREY